MSKTSNLLATACLLVAFGFAGSAQAQTFTYSVTGGGGQAQIGEALPIPIQRPTTRGSGPGTGMSPIATGTEFPGDRVIGSLAIPADTGKTVMQQVDGAGLPLKLTVPQARFKRVPTGYLALGVARFNPKVFQVRTNLSLSAPGAFDTISPTKNTMTFAAYNRTSTGGVMGGPNTTTFMGAPPESSFIVYRNTFKRFGGPSQTRVEAKSDVWAWVNGVGVKPPCKAFAFGGNPTDPDDAGCHGALLVAHPGELAAGGGPVGFADQTTPPFAQSPGVAQLSITMASGTINSSKSFVMTASVRNTASSFGFPWTVGMITLKQSQALGTPEVFEITGMDGRNPYGVGTLSLVAGALSDRTLSGPNANRSWARYVLPEPEAVLGAGAALAVLGICHALVRRRH